MIEKIDHIGIAVEDLEEASAFYRDKLGLEFLGTEDIPSQKVKAALFRVGESRIELLQPMSPDSPLAAFLEKRGPGLHHVAYTVADAGSVVERLVSTGVEMIDRVPRTGAGGSRIAFIHPRSSGKVLSELCEHSTHEKEGSL